MDEDEEDNSKPIEIEINEEEGWTEIRIDPGVGIGAILFLIALCYYLSSY